MAGPFDLTGQNIEDTYQRILQTDGTNIYNGTGSLFSIPSAFPYTGSALITGSLGVTGSLNVASLYTTISNTVASFVGGVAYIGSNFANVQGNLGVGSFGNPGARLAVKGSGTTSATNTFRAENSNSFPSLVVRDDGKVGIGTASPSQPFQVQHIGTSGTTGSLVFYNQDNAYTSLGVTSNGVGFALSSHTNGTGYISANSSLNFTAYNTDNPAVLWIGNGSRFRFSNTAETSTYLVVANSGNVLVNKSTDSGYKFDVSGSIRSTNGVNITGSFSSYTTSSAGFLAVVSGSQPLQDAAFNFRKIGESPDGGRHTMIVEGSGAQDNNIYFGVGQVGGTKGSILCVKGNNSVNINMPLPTINYGGLAVGGWLAGYPSLLVRGFGATSATTALRVENTNASASLVVLDDGSVTAYNNLTVTGSISTSTNTTGQSTLGTGLVVNNTAGSSTINDFQVKSQLYNAIYVSSSADSIGLMSNASGKLGFFGATPTTQSAGWSVANYLVSKSFDANTVTLEQLADVVGTILTELKNKGLLG